MLGQEKIPKTTVRRRKEATQVSQTHLVENDLMRGIFDSHFFFIFLGKKKVPGVRRTEEEQDERADIDLDPALAAVLPDDRTILW